MWIECIRQADCHCKCITEKFTEPWHIRKVFRCIQIKYITYCVRIWTGKFLNNTQYCDNGHIKSCANNFRVQIAKGHIVKIIVRVDSISTVQIEKLFYPCDKFFEAFFLNCETFIKSPCKMLGVPFLAHFRKRDFACNTNKMCKVNRW